MTKKDFLQGQKTVKYPKIPRKEVTTIFPSKSLAI
jgi:hypothetical protein